MPFAKSRSHVAEVPAGPYRTRQTVVATRAQGAIVLLDRERESYITLNHVAADIWEQLASGAVVAEIVDRVCVQYAAPREQVAADVRAQIQEFLQRGLIELGAKIENTPAAAAGAQLVWPAATEPRPLPPSAPSADVALPSHLWCILLISGVRLRLAIQGYVSTINWVRRRVESVPATARASVGAVGAAEYRLAMAAALYPGRAMCLERSLALYYLLRRQGVAVRYCQGVQPYPFQAHAWIEYQGEVLNDVPEHANQFTRLPDQLP